MVIFGDEDNMVERFVEIDARVFLEGTAHIASGFCWKTQKTRVFAAISLRSKVLKEALKHSATLSGTCTVYVMTARFALLFCGAAPHYLPHRTALNVFLLPPSVCVAA